MSAALTVYLRAAEPSTMGTATPQARAPQQHSSTPFVDNHLQGVLVGQGQLIAQRLWLVHPAVLRQRRPQLDPFVTVCLALELDGNAEQKAALQVVVASMSCPLHAWFAGSFAGSPQCCRPAPAGCAACLWQRLTSQTV